MRGFGRLRKWRWNLFSGTCVLGSSLTFGHRRTAAKAGGIPAESLWRNGAQTVWLSGHVTPRGQWEYGVLDGHERRQDIKSYFHARTEGAGWTERHPHGYQRHMLLPAAPYVRDINFNNYYIAHVQPLVHTCSSSYPTWLPCNWPLVKTEFSPRIIPCGEEDMQASEYINSFFSKWTFRRSFFKAMVIVFMLNVTCIE